MIQYDTLPARLDKVLDDVGAGAMLRNLESGHRARIIDFDDVNGFRLPLLLQVRPEIAEGDELPHLPEHYEVIGPIDNPTEWLVLTRGDDEVLCE